MIATRISWRASHGSDHARSGGLSRGYLETATCRYSAGRNPPGRSADRESFGLPAVGNICGRGARSSCPNSMTASGDSHSPFFLRNLGWPRGDLPDRAGGGAAVMLRAASSIGQARPHRHEQIESLVCRRGVVKTPLWLATVTRLAGAHRRLTCWTRAQSVHGRTVPHATRHSCHSDCRLRTRTVPEWERNI